LRLLQFAVLAIVTLIVAVFVIRPILSSRRVSPESPTGSLSAPTAVQTERAGQAALSAPEAGEPDLGPVTVSGPESRSLPAINSGETPPHAALNGDPVMRLKTMIEGRQPDTLEVLRNWLEDDEIGEKA